MGLTHVELRWVGELQSCFLVPSSGGNLCPSWACSWDPGQGSLDFGHRTWAQILASPWDPCTCLLLSRASLGCPSNIAKQACANSISLVPLPSRLISLESPQWVASSSSKVPELELSLISFPCHTRSSPDLPFAWAGQKIPQL